jgi:ERCC4-related helicase
MVDRVPLVFQQARAIEEQCETKNLRVGRFCGEKPHANWKLELDNVDVAVITAGLLKNALETRAFGLEDIELLIVDEAHHCLKVCILSWDRISLYLIHHDIESSI